MFFDCMPPAAMIGGAGLIPVADFVFGNQPTKTSPEPIVVQGAGQIAYAGNTSTSVAITGSLGGVGGS